MQVSAQGLDTLEVVALVELLVSAVGHIRAAAHWQQQNILAGCLLKRQRNGDTATC